MAKLAVMSNKINTNTSIGAVHFSISSPKKQQQKIAINEMFFYKNVIHIFLVLLYICRRTYDLSFEMILPVNW